MSLHRFSWVVEGELAAMGAPDGYDEDFRELRTRGVGALVSLTEDPLLADGAECHGFPYLHLAVSDGTAPEMSQVDRFMEFCDQNVEQKRLVAVHCLAGIGRTGTMAACYLVRKGMDTEDAIARIRSMRPRSIETIQQEGAVYEYECRVAESC